MQKRLTLFPVLAGVITNVMTAAPVWAKTAHDAGDPGFPQLNPVSYPSQLFWLFVSFTLLYFLMSRVALPKVGGALERRDRIIEDNLDLAGKVNKEAEELQTGYEEALAKAHAEASENLRAAEEEMAKKVTQETERFAADALRRIQEAEAAVQKAKDKAMDDIPVIAADIAADIVGKITGANVNKTEAQKAVTTIIGKG